MFALVVQKISSQGLSTPIHPEHHLAAKKELLGLRHLPLEGCR
jgi:hypothetical protein